MPPDPASSLTATVAPMSPAPRPSRMRPLLSSVVLRSQSDARLTRLAAEGHQAAFAVIFERYERELRAHAARIVRPARVDDALQHTMLSAWSSLLAGNTIDDLRPWLHQIVHNACLNTTRRRGYDDAELPSTAAATALTEDIVQGRLTAGEALTAIAALPPAQRQALTLTAIDGRSARDAAADMGVSENALRQLVYRARSSMREAVSAVTPLPLLLSAAGHAGAGSLGAGAGTVGGAGLVSSAAAAGGGSVAVKTAAIVAIAAGAVGATTLHRDQPPHHAQAARLPVATATTSPPPPEVVPSRTPRAPAVGRRRPVVTVAATSPRRLPATGHEAHRRPSERTDAGPTRQDDDTRPVALRRPSLPAGTGTDAHEPQTTDDAHSAASDATAIAPDDVSSGAPPPSGDHQTDTTSGSEDAADLP